MHFLLSTQHFETLNSGFPEMVQNGGRSRGVCEEISVRNWQILRAGTDCTESYFENKDVELSYLNEIWAAY